MKTDERKIVIIGLDGADPLLMKALLEGGHLPTLGRFAREGVFLPLASTTPWHSGPAWTAFATGANPGKTGIFSFFMPPENYVQRPAYYSDVPLPAFWEIAGAAGVKCGVLNVPMTHPPRPFNGFMVAGYPCRDGKSSYPVEFHKLLEGQKKSGFPLPAYLDVVSPYIKVTLYRDAVVFTEAPRLMEENGARVLVLAAEFLDRVQHFYWHEMDGSHPSHNPDSPEMIRTIVPTSYLLADTMIAYLMKEIGDDADYIVCSDHGFMPTPGLFDLGGLLSSRGLAVFRDLEIARRSQDEGMFDVSKLLEMKKSRIYLTHASMMNAIGLNVNLKGREPEGIVDPAEAGALVAEVRAVFEEEKDPRTGARIFPAVYTGRELYKGDFAGAAPDILAVCRCTLALYPMNMPGIVPMNPPLPGDARDPLQHTGVHRREGVFMALGPDINPLAMLTREAALADVAPSVLHLLGLSPPAYMDGTLLPIFTEEVMNKETAPAPEVRREAAGSEAGISEEEMKDTMDHLKGMGYI